MARGTLNKVLLIGRLGGDPTIRMTPSGVSCANFNLATNEAWKDAGGQLTERTDWHRVVAWRKLADFVGQYVKKGSLVYVEGKLQTRTVDDAKNPGKKMYFTEVVADTIQFIGSRPESSTADVPPLPEEHEKFPDNGGDHSMPASPMGGEDADDLPF
ncbi:MAG: single-stranded DNA-binding protein [Candidatus Delongbacteria bacterium]|nr:single-stranded DNA-binding protein [Candidatus Delongbacteria bacterium]